MKISISYNDDSHNLKTILKALEFPTASSLLCDTVLWAGSHSLELKSTMLYIEIQTESPNPVRCS
jgi:hypothetical protein